MIIHLYFADHGMAKNAIQALHHQEKTMSPRNKPLSIILIGLFTWLPLNGAALALDIDKAHVTAIQNCVNWHGETRDYCTCVQDKLRADLPGGSYLAMMQYAEAYEQNRRADLAAMQVDAELSKALEPVDAVVAAAENACRG